MKKHTIFFIICFVVSVITSIIIVWYNAIMNLKIINYTPTSLELEVMSSGKQYNITSDENFKIIRHTPKSITLEVISTEKQYFITALENGNISIATEE